MAQVEPGNVAPLAPQEAPPKEIKYACCCCCPIPDYSVDVAVDGDALAASRTVDPQEIADLDVYMSTLSGPHGSGLAVVQELGLITSTFTRLKTPKPAMGTTQQFLTRWVVESATEAESARAMALGKLRTKARRAGANAVLGLKVDIETEEAPGRFGVSMTLVVASGTAVVLGGGGGGPLVGVVVTQDASQCLYAGAYTGGPLVASPASFEMAR